MLESGKKYYKNPLYSTFHKEKEQVADSVNQPVRQSNNGRRLYGSKVF